MLHEMIRNDDFERNTELQYWNNAATVRNNIATLLKGCVALKSSLRIVPCNITLSQGKEMIPFGRRLARVFPPC